MEVLELCVGLGVVEGRGRRGKLPPSGRQSEASVEEDVSDPCPLGVALHLLKEKMEK